MGKFSPANLEIIEFNGSTQTITMIADDTAPEPANTETFIINNVEFVTKSKQPRDLNISWENDTFTFSSSFSDMFDRTIKYIIQDTVTWKTTYGMSSRFVDLPSNYSALYEYIPPSVVFTEYDFKVEATGSVSGDVVQFWTLVVRYNSDISNANLSDYASKGITI